MKVALVITYYWPPAGGPGVQRWLKFVKYFREFGVEPIVYVPENPSYPLVDENFTREVPDDITILKHPIKEPYEFAKLLSRKKTKDISSGIITKENPSALEKLMLYVRGNYFIPDARVGWVKPSEKFLSEFLTKNSVDVLITTGPPHSVHLIGMALKESFGMQWIADFRDPWTTIHYHKSLRLTEASQKKHKKLEKDVLDGADVVVVTSPTTKKEFSKVTETPIEVITNGYDVSEEIEVSLDREFSMAHIGSLLGGRNPQILWKVLSEISREVEGFQSDLKLRFAGAISDEVKASLMKFDLDKHAEFLGYISHQEALKLQRKSQLLLLIEIDSVATRAIIPGKLFEYLSAERPIIALGPEGSDIAPILSDTKAGGFFSYAEKERLKEHILKRYEQYKSGGLTVDSEGVEKYSRKNLTGQMSDLIYRIS